MASDEVLVEKYLSCFTVFLGTSVLAASNDQFGVF